MVDDTPREPRVHPEDLAKGILQLADVLAQLQEGVWKVGLALFGVGFIMMMMIFISGSTVLHAAESLPSPCQLPASHPLHNIARSLREISHGAAQEIEARTQLALFKQFQELRQHFNDTMEGELRAIEVRLTDHQERSMNAYVERTRQALVNLKAFAKYMRPTYIDDDDSLRGACMDHRGNACE